jgi:hypothetical protein
LGEGAKAKEKHHLGKTGICLLGGACLVLVVFVFNSKNLAWTPHIISLKEATTSLYSLTIAEIDEEAREPQKHSQA